MMLVFVAVFPHWTFLSFQATFLCHWHCTRASKTPEDVHQLWALPWLLSVALLFALLFRNSFTASATFLSKHFLITGVFLPHTSSPTYLEQFVTQMWAGTSHPGSSSVPDLTELSLPANTWTWTTHILVTRPLIYQLRQWATKYRVRIATEYLLLAQSHM